MLLDRSPIVEDDQGGKENAVISQDYHLMHMGISKSPAKGSIENSLE